MSKEAEILESAGVNVLREGRQYTCLAIYVESFDPMELIVTVDERLPGASIQPIEGEFYKVLVSRVGELNG